MTLGNMRDLGVQRLIASCLNPACRHTALIEVWSYPADTEIPYFKSRVVCAKCASRRDKIDVRPNWNEQTPQSSLTGKERRWNASILYAFDVLELDGHDLRREPWSDRRGKLARLLGGGGHGVQLSDHMEGTDGEAVFGHACAMGFEGIVAKRRDRPYRSGRSSDWIKVKNPDAPATTRLVEGWCRPW
jgi:ATP dependent DNA ligase domain